MLATLYITGTAETARSLSGQSTGLTDLLLAECEQSSLPRLDDKLPESAFVTILTSPLWNYVVWRSDVVIGSIELVFLGMALMRLQRMLVQPLA